VTRIVYDYIKHCNLYKETENDNKRYINPDASIKELFSMGDDEEIGFFNFQTYMCRLFPKKAKDNEEDEEDEEEVEVEEAAQDEEEVEEPEPVKTKSKSKSKVPTANV
jgi:hypothetical protein